MALRISVQIQKPGDFAAQGYEDSYPVSQYSLVLVPPGTPDAQIYKASKYKYLGRVHINIKKF